LRAPHKPHSRDQPGDQFDRGGGNVCSVALFKLAVQLLQIASEGLVWAKAFRFHLRPPQAPTEADSYTRTKREQAAPYKLITGEYVDGNHLPAANPVQDKR